MKTPSSSNYKIPISMSSLKDKDPMHIKGKGKEFRSSLFPLNSLLSHSGKASQSSNRLSIQTVLKNMDSNRKVSKLFSGMTITSVGNSK